MPGRLFHCASVSLDQYRCRFDFAIEGCRHENHDRRVVAPDGVLQMPPDQEFLRTRWTLARTLFAPRGRLPMLLVGYEARGHS